MIVVLLCWPFLSHFYVVADHCNSKHRRNDTKISLFFLFLFFTFLPAYNCSINAVKLEYAADASWVSRDRTKSLDERCCKSFLVLQQPNLFQPSCRCVCGKWYVLVNKTIVLDCAIMCSIFAAKGACFSELCCFFCFFFKYLWVFRIVVIYYTK